MPKTPLVAAVTCGLALAALLSSGLLDQGSLAQTSSNCSSVRSQFASELGSARASLSSCEQANVGTWSSFSGRGYSGKAVCLGVPVMAEACVSGGQAVCAVIARRDSAVADCRAREKVSKLMQLARDKERLDAMSLAKTGASELNDLRGRVGNKRPGNVLSRELTDLAIGQVDAQGRQALDQFQSAFGDRDGSAAGGSSVQQALDAYRFQPLEAGGEAPRPSVELPEDYAALRAMARQAVTSDYDLPFGSDFTSSGPAQEMLHAATEAALDGDPSGFDGRTGLSAAIGGVARDEQQVRNRSNSLYDRESGLAALSQAEAAADEVERARQRIAAEKRRRAKAARKERSADRDPRTCHRIVRHPTPHGIQKFRNIVTNACDGPIYVFTRTGAKHFVTGWALFSVNRSCGGHSHYPDCSRVLSELDGNEIVASCKVEEATRLGGGARLSYAHLKRPRFPRDPCWKMAQCVMDTGKGPGVCW